MAIKEFLSTQVARQPAYKDLIDNICSLLEATKSDPVYGEMMGLLTYELLADNQVDDLELLYEFLKTTINSTETTYSNLIKDFQLVQTGISFDAFFYRTRIFTLLFNFNG